MALKNLSKNNHTLHIGMLFYVCSVNKMPWGSCLIKIIVGLILCHESRKIDEWFGFGGSTAYFRGYTSQVWTSTTSAWVEIWKKKILQLYYIKMKLPYDLGFLAIGVAIAT